MKTNELNKAYKSLGISYLSNYNVSAKLVKNMKVNNQLTVSLYLAPFKLSGYNTCPFATKECIKGCLNQSGRVKIEQYKGESNIVKSRIKKTKLFFENRALFMDILIAEIEKYRKIAIAQNAGFSCRLNCTSDIDWNSVKHNGQTIFEIFQDVQFYDYTKNPNKFINKPANYHLTFSHTGRNNEACKNILQAGNNIAVVFDVKKNSPLPEQFMNYNVIDGDLTDYRPADKLGQIVGLRFKDTANKAVNTEVRNSCFVIH